MMWDVWVKSEVGTCAVKWYKTVYNNPIKKKFPNFWEINEKLFLKFKEEKIISQI